MEWYQVIILALVQGVTEFLPISSSGHLILPAQLLGWPDQGVAFDVAVHLGSLLAVVAYFRRDLLQLAGGVVVGLSQRQMNEQVRLTGYLFVATLPAILVGLLCKDWIGANLRTSIVIAVSTLVFGLLMGFADYSSSKTKDILQLTLMSALVIGIAQAFALIPGTSRSGITVTAALLLGFNRTASARFSFLLSIPLILGAGLLLSLDAVKAETVFQWEAFGLGILVSAVSAYACIHLFLQWIERAGLMPFVWYRIALAALLVALYYSWI